VILNDSNYVKVNISLYSTAEILSEDIARLSINKNINSKWSIYISTQTLKRMPLSKSVIKLVQPEEKIMNLIKKLDDLELPHIFYAFPNSECTDNKSLNGSVLTENLLKDKTWKKVGNLSFKLEKAESNADKKKQFISNTFYLGHDSLCCFNKDCNFTS